MENVDLKNETPTFGNVLCVPVLGQTYNYFDDGKIKPSRRMEVVITEIIPFNEIDKEKIMLMNTFRASKTQILRYLIFPYSIPVFISALTKENFPEMKRMIYDEVMKIHISRFPYNDFLFEYFDNDDENN